MSDIISVEKSADGSASKIEIPDLDILPENVRELFDKLPDSIRSRLLPEIQRKESVDSDDGRQWSLEEVVASFDTKTREKYVAQCLMELFDIARFDKLLQEINIEDLKVEIESLLDLLWQNRGKRDDDIEIFNQDYYDEFFLNRTDIANKIDSKRLEIESLKVDINRIKAKRYGETKQQELAIHEVAMRELVDELEGYDRQHGNLELDYNYYRNVAARQKKERKWTEAVTVSIEYLDAAEFVVAVSEQLSRTFNMEFYITSNGSWFGRIPTEEVMIRAEEIVQLVSDATGDWYEDHLSDGRYKDVTDAKLEERHAKLIDYLISLISSYRLGKVTGRSDEDLLYTVKQMEITLRILGK